MTSDIGDLGQDFLQPHQAEQVILQGHRRIDSTFPKDRAHGKFPVLLLSKSLPSGERRDRDWLVWTQSKTALFCLSCRLFRTNALQRSHLCRPDGYSGDNLWKKLYDRVPSHENSTEHYECYVEWRETEARLRAQTSVNALLIEDIATEAEKWRDILTRIRDAILFLGERGSALRGSSHLIGGRNNGNFLSLLELLSRHDPLLRVHLGDVRKSQRLHQRMQVHYLSYDIQNEFIELCSRHVITKILEERAGAKYYTVMVDATPDASHVEQTTFILRFMRLQSDKRAHQVEERFLASVDCHGKTGEVIATLICDTLAEHGIPLIECRGQAYDNGRNMSGECKGAQSRILAKNPYALYAPCAAHTLNLAGVDTAQCCPRAISFFGIVQKCYNIFSSSTQRWEISNEYVANSLHTLSDTRWSARIDVIKPFAANLPGLRQALRKAQGLNLTAESRRDIDGIL
ncbi:zinc finger MYM-type protein 1-like [Galendromus occidentalis]|uniref:Zinc finger MYM-type protein 1-like n=1 Tax=Galendromus occidentalis TaxID=34638 RepID=A0AAJ6VW11_9ACAR|nr:zinc finger MYM-type protein 1-like [Galendromus occidentalis]